MLRLCLNCLFVFILFSPNAYSLQQTFQEILKKVLENSDKLKSSQFQIELNEKEHSRLARHWIPHASLGVSSFQTNDPGAVLFNYLGQGSVKQTDFVPSTLNNPGNKTFHNATIGITLPLYEGFKNVYSIDMKKYQVDSSKKILESNKNVLFAATLLNFANISTLVKSNVKLRYLGQEIDVILKKYTLGSKKNPVGYSGLLGLRNVKNRIIGMIRGHESKISYHKEMIKFESKLESVDVKPITNLTEFLTKNAELNKQKYQSSQLESYFLQFESLKLLPKLQRSRFLPQIGIFAKNDYYKGDRDDANNQTVGLYLRWDLFNNDSFGRIAEANTQVKTFNAKLNHSQKQEQAFRNSLKSIIVALEKNKETLKLSDQILTEQIKTTFMLFRSGKINALQLAEVLNRRVDLIGQEVELEDQYITKATEYYQINH